jgi:hypothetical protein
MCVLEQTVLQEEINRVSIRGDGCSKMPDVTFLSYLGCSGFKSQPIYQLFWLPFPWLSSVPPGTLEALVLPIISS